jgi:histidinol-phosphate aminotransferase
VSLCQELVQATCNDGDEVIFAWRSFEAYPVVTQVAGATPVKVPLTADHGHDLDAMLAAITDRTRLIFVCNPNNPTGTALTKAELERFLDAVPADVLVALDEAYFEYNRSDADGIALFRGRPNVVVLRTFSKAYGLAGLRVGYAIADPEVAASIRKATPPFTVTDLAQTAAVASLESADELMERVESIVAERTRVRRALIAQGWNVPDSQANFVWLPLGDDATAFADACAPLSVRPFAGDGVRVSIGDPAANDRFLEAAARFHA